MDKAARNKLKQFLEDNIPFHELKKVGVFAKDVRKTDYEKIAARICEMFGLKSIYEYATIMDEEEAESPLTWRKLEIDTVDMVSKDSWLN